MLIEKLDKYLNKNYYPFYMPGHKRNKNILNKKLPYDRDITEIDGFDNLNDPKTIFKQMKESLKDIYKVDDFIISTNGSTSGILSVIRTLTRFKKNILIQRNSHKSVYNAIDLFDLNPSYIDLKFKDDIAFDIDYEDIEKRIKEEDYSLILLTSPSYEGFILDFKKIRKICKNIPIVLDMAHGSHLILDDLYDDIDFDIAITSFHKNLSALTPASGVLVKNKNIDKKELRRNMAIFQTSSPSYIISQSIDDMLTNFPKFPKLYKNLNKNLDKLYKTKLSNLKFINDKNKDRSKIVISCKNTNISGNDLKDLLYKEKIDIEMAFSSYVILISSIFDMDYGFERLKNALIKIDKNIKFKEESEESYEFSYKIPKKAISISKALLKDKKIGNIEKLNGHISGGFIYAYPPGIPLIVPGEVFDNEIIENIKKLIKLGLDINLVDGGFYYID